MTYPKEKFIHPLNILLNEVEIKCVHANPQHKTTYWRIANMNLCSSCSTQTVIHSVSFAVSSCFTLFLIYILKSIEIVFNRIMKWVIYLSIVSKPFPLIVFQTQHNNSCNAPRAIHTFPFDTNAVGASIGIVFIAIVTQMVEENLFTMCRSVIDFNLWSSSVSQTRMLIHVLVVGWQQSHVGQ